MNPDLFAAELELVSTSEPELLRMDLVVLAGDGSQLLTGALTRADENRLRDMLNRREAERQSKAEVVP